MGLLEHIGIGLGALALAGCSNPPNSGAGAAGDPDAAVTLGGASLGPDSGSRPDGALPGSDAAIFDAGPSFDAGPQPDAAPLATSEIRFSDVTSAAGILSPHKLSSFAQFATGQAWGDYDGDGWLDLYVTNGDGPNHLYRNLQNGQFQQVVAPELALVEHTGGGATFVDYDNDGDKDLYVVNDGENQLFRNDSGSFVNVTDVAGVGDWRRGTTASWADFDGDGWLDLYVANWRCLDCVGIPGEPFSFNADQLYRNNGDGTFDNVSPLMSPSLRNGHGFVGTFFDYDNDGDLDLYVANDHGEDGPDGELILRNVLWRNDGLVDGEWSFVEVAVELGADLRQKAMGIAVGDIDNDGDLDAASTDIGPVQILRNQGGSFSASPEPPPANENLPWQWGLVFVDFDLDGWLDLYVGNGSGRNQVFHNVLGAFEDVSFDADEAGLGLSYGVAYADYDQDGRPDLAIGQRSLRYRLLRNTSDVDAAYLTLVLAGGGPVNRDAIGARVTLTRSDGVVLTQEVKCGSSLGAGNALELYFGLGNASVSSLSVRWPNGLVQDVGSVAANQRLSISYPE